LTLLLKLDILLSLAGVAELADAHDSKSCSFGNVGSIPTFGITAANWRFLFELEHLYSLTNNFKDSSKPSVLLLDSKIKKMLTAGGDLLAGFV
jgi:hypothetical protein